MQNVSIYYLNFHFSFPLELKENMLKHFYICINDNDLFDTVFQEINTILRDDDVEKISGRIKPHIECSDVDPDRVRSRFIWNHGPGSGFESGSGSGSRGMKSGSTSLI